MTALSIQPTFPIFTDIDGQPLENGYIWIGTTNLNPQTNPINVYWDAALTIPATQPIRTLAGYPSNSGTPARLYVNSNYSIQVQNRNGSIVYSAPAATERYGNIINADGVIYQPAGTGAVATTVQAKLRESISVMDFGATGDGTTDDTASIQAAIDATPTGGSLFIPVGTYLVTDTLTCPLPISIFGAGSGSVILVGASVDGNTDIIRVYPTSSVVELKDWYSLKDFYIKPVSGTPGRHAIRVDASAANIAQMMIDRVWIAKLGNISIFADGVNTPSLFHITNCQIQNGISIPDAGDTIWITGNQISGDNYGLDITFTPGALMLMLVGNNITNKNGVHIGVPANFSVISDNEFETFGTFIGSNGAVVDIDGDSSNEVNDFVIARNSFSIINGIAAYGIRVNYANRTSISDNRFFRSSGVQTLINITSNANNTYVGTNMFDNSGPFTQMITNNGSNTVIAAAFLANFIIPSSNVGIGTAAPSSNAALEIQAGSVYPALLAQSGGTTSGSTIVDFRNGANATGFKLTADNLIKIPGYATGGANKTLQVDSAGNIVAV